MVKKHFQNPKKILDQFRKKLEKKIRVQKMILFGSYARGTPRDYSDIDVAVISPDFKGDSMKDGLLLDQTACEVTSLIEPFPYRPEDLRHVKPGQFLAEILRTGKVIYTRSSFAKLS